MTVNCKKPMSWFKQKPQIRKRFNEAEERQLGESLKVRQLQPLVCLPDGTIIAGERRYRAGLLAGMTELEVKIIDDPVTEAECKRLQFTENMLRQDLTGYEQFQGCVEMLRLNPGWTQKDLAEKLHIDPSMVIRLLSPSKCIESVRAALAEGKIGISDCYAISRLSEAEQAAALAMKLNGASRDELASHARRQKSRSTSHNNGPAVKLSRVKIPLAGGGSLALSGKELSLLDVVETLAAVLRDAKKAAETYDVKTWMRMWADRIKE